MFWVSTRSITHSFLAMLIIYQHCLLLLTVLPRNGTQYLLMQKVIVVLLATWEGK